MPPNKRLHCGSHIDRGISQRRENDATTLKLGGRDARSGKFVFKLASLNELEPYDNLNAAVKLNFPARRESSYWRVFNKR